MGINVETIDQRKKEKGESNCITCDFFSNYILEHSTKDWALDVFALAIYSLMIIRG